MACALTLAYGNGVVSQFALRGLRIGGTGRAVAGIGVQVLHDRCISIKVSAGVRRKKMFAFATAQENVRITRLTRVQAFFI